MRCLCSKDSKDAFNFLVKYLSTFGKDEAGSAEAKEGAARAAVDYIKAPDAFQVRGPCSGAIQVRGVMERGGWSGPAGRTD